MRPSARTTWGATTAADTRAGAGVGHRRSFSATTANSRSAHSEEQESDLTTQAADVEPPDLALLNTPSPEASVSDPQNPHGAPTVDSPSPATSPPGPTALGTTHQNIYLGVTSPSPQHGVLGEVAGRTVALDLNETHTISLFGVQGGGKSYTLGSIIEAASLPSPPVNVLPHPLATVVFHYSQTQDYAPEFTWMAHPNDDSAQLDVLKGRYGAEPRALTTSSCSRRRTRSTKRQRSTPASRSIRWRSPPPSSRPPTGGSSWAPWATSPPTSAS